MIIMAIVQGTAPAINRWRGAGMEKASKVMGLTIAVATIILVPDIYLLFFFFLAASIGQVILLAALLAYGYYYFREESAGESGWGRVITGGALLALGTVFMGMHLVSYPTMVDKITSSAEWAGSGLEGTAKLLGLTATLESWFTLTNAVIILYALYLILTGIVTFKLVSGVEPGGAARARAVAEHPANEPMRERLDALRDRLEEIAAEDARIREARRDVLDRFERAVLPEEGVLDREALERAIRELREELNRLPGGGA